MGANLSAVAGTPQDIGPTVTHDRSVSDVLTTTVHVATRDRDDLVAARDVARAASGGHDATRTLVGVTVLGHPDQLVEAEAVAVRDTWREPGPPYDASTVGA